ncbi:hypothetical protein DUI87_18405 [Hirundo rustica rustica]|uniref:Uncharacterized protein n=1 Tax=Hirundo rustica rustica TaxID=333673 RepID=A0A3M0JYH7_HIRRU|nr:hypothetical protein DUI87_18405 [Hirundo rustica rustica]
MLLLTGKEETQSSSDMAGSSGVHSLEPASLGGNCNRNHKILGGPRCFYTPLHDPGTMGYKAIMFLILFVTVLADRSHCGLIPHDDLRNQMLKANNSITEALDSENGKMPTNALPNIPKDVKTLSRFAFRRYGDEYPQYPRAQCQAELKSRQNHLEGLGRSINAALEDGLLSQVNPVDKMLFQFGVYQGPFSVAVQREKDIDLLQQAQRKATKVIKWLEHLSYEDRLRELKLLSLEKGKLQGDMALFSA